MNSRISIALIILLLTACHHNNPLKTQPSKSSATFLVNASANVEKRLHFAIQKNAYGFGYLECMEGSNGPLSKLATSSKVRGDGERKTAVYTQVHEDLSTASTKQFADVVEFGKRSNEIHCPELLDGMVAFAKENHYPAFKHITLSDIADKFVFEKLGDEIAEVAATTWPHYFTIGRLSS